GLSVADAVDAPPGPTTSPSVSTPLPSIATLCDSCDGLAIVIVTLPALASRLFVSYFSCPPGSALMLSFVLVPVAWAGAALRLLLFDPPPPPLQPGPATISAPAVPARSVERLLDIDVDRRLLVRGRGMLVVLEDREER